MTNSSAEVRMYGFHLASTMINGNTLLARYSFLPSRKSQIATVERGWASFPLVLITSKELELLENSTQTSS